MSAGTCPAGVCGTVSITGDTTSTLTYTISLATGVSFHGPGDFLYFQLTDPGGNPITFSNVTTGGPNFSFTGPTTSGGPFTPSNGNFPGPYNYAASCTTSVAGNLCGSTFSFIASGATSNDPFVIGQPPGHGISNGFDVGLVADLSVSGSCGDGVKCNPGTGLVGDPLAPAVPEPATWAMMILGFAGLGFLAYRRRGSTPRFA
jgi:hypothetical protein